MYAKGQRPGRSSGQASSRCWLAMLPVLCCLRLYWLSMPWLPWLPPPCCMKEDVFGRLWNYLNPYDNIVHRLRLFPRSLRNVHPKWSNMIQPYVVYWYRHQLHPSPGSVLGEGTAENPADKFTPGAPQGILQGRAEMLETVEKSIIWN